MTVRDTSIEFSEIPRVAVFTNTYLPRLVGPSIAIENLFEALGDEGKRMQIIAPEYRSLSQRRLKENAVNRVASYRQLGIIDWAAPLPLVSDYQARKFLDVFQPEVIHVHQPFLLGRTGVVEAKRRGIPLIYTYHTFYEHYVHYATWVGRKIISNYVNRRLSQMLTQADTVVVPTPQVLEKLRQEGFTGDVNIVPTGVETRQFETSTSLAIQCKEELNIEPEQKILLYVGRLVKEKRVDFLLDMMAKLKANPEFVLVVVGGGTQTNALVKRAKEIAVNDQIRWVGYKAPTALNAYYQAADLFAFPSISDTQAIVLYESIAAGTPIIAVDSLAAQTAISNQANGRIVANDTEIFADAVRSFTNNLSSAPQLDATYEITNTIEAYAQIYRSATSQSKLSVASLTEMQPDS